MVRHNQLSEWQKTSLSRPPHPIQLLPCQTRENWMKNGKFGIVDPENWTTG
jgi:hypothetical protein